MRDVLKDFEAFQIHFQRGGDFYLEIWGFCKDFEAFKSNFQISGGFLMPFPDKLRLLFRNVELL
jgi:hypothetical protein